MGYPRQKEKQAWNPGPSIPPTRTDFQRMSQPESGSDHAAHAENGALPAQVVQKRTAMKQ